MTSRTHEILHKGAILLLVAGPLVGTAIAMTYLWQQYIFTSDLVLLAVMYVITAMGIGTGYHRMLTHQGFQAPEWLRGLILICGSMAFEGPADIWTATHIKHHAHSDEEGDPHSPLEGFWHAHIGWLFSIKNFPLVSEYAPHLLKDKTVRFVSRNVFLWMGLSLLIPYLLGGWTGFIWGGAVRIFLVSHVTWSVNSICHTFGKRAFETTDESRNEWIIGLLALGEGWHNNHHAFPANAFHGMRWWQFDLNGLFIRALEKTGLVWNVQRVSRETEHAHQSRAAAMIQALTELRQTVMDSIASARRELSIYVTDTAMHQQAMHRLDTMRETIAHSAHLKRQKLVQYQREAQGLVQEWKHKWEVVKGSLTTA